jgi:hypothetical protein
MQSFLCGTTKGAGYYTRPSTFDLRPTCMKWKNVFDQEMKNINSEEHKKSEICLIDIIKSGRRRYIVKGLALSGAQGSSQRQEYFICFYWSGYIRTV